VLKYQQEFLEKFESEAKHLLELHWEEIALNKDHIKLNPDWEAYYELEAQGKLKVFTARDGLNLVGYFVVVVSSHLHYKDHIFAANDVIYLHKDYRKSFAGVSLVKFAERCLKDDGVSVLTINTKVHQPFDKMLDRLEFENTERVYSKYLGGT